MARVSGIQTGFNNGEVSPYMYGRVDAEKYPLSVREMTNMLAIVQGPAAKRDGTRFVCPVADESQLSRLFEFEFSPTQGYAIELNGSRARFLTNRGLVLESAKAVTAVSTANPAQVTSNAHGYANGDQVVFPVVGPYAIFANQVFTVAGAAANTFNLLGFNGAALPAFSGSPTVARVYSIASPFASADLDKVTDLHQVDVLTLMHPNYQPRLLARSGATNWAFSKFVFKNGPYLTEDPKGVTLTPAGTGSLTPPMTSNTLPSGVASTSNASANDYRMFDRDKTQDNLVSTIGNGFIRYQLGGGTKHVVDAYWLTTSNVATGNNDYFTDWQFQGSHNGVDWITLDTRQKETGWGNAETRYYSFSNTVAFEYHQMLFTGGGGPDATNSVSAELSMHIAQSDQTAFALTASGTTSINGGLGFVATDVGRNIRLLGSDGLWRWAVIDTVTSTTVVQVRIAGHSLPDISPISRWRLGLFSDTTGWPSCGAYYQDRQAFAGPPTYPNYMCFSEASVYDSFSPSEDDGTVTDASGFAYALLEQHVTAINWLRPVEHGLIIGTAEGEAVAQPLITSFTRPSPFSALNVRFVWPTKYGSNQVRPRGVDTATLFVDRRGKRLREMTYDPQGDTFVAPNMSAMADHITSPGGVKRVAFLRHPNRILFGVRGDGRLLGLSYEREQNVTAWHSHILGGLNAKVEDTIAISSPDGQSEDLWMIVTRTIGGVTRRYIEYTGDWWTHDTLQADACFVDGSIKYSGAPATVIAGLSHLEGETVRILADGNQQEDQTVVGGKITLAVAASKVTVGLAYKARLWTLRPNIGAQGGTAQGKMKKVYQYVLRLYRSLGGKIGDSSGRQNEIPYWSIANSFLKALGLFSGDVGPLALPTAWELDGGTVFENDSAYPFTIIAYMPQVAEID